MEPPEKIDYLVIGHICHDLTPEGKVVGGSSAYASSVAHASGCRAAVVTSCNKSEDWSNDLPEVKIHVVPSPLTTIFENVYLPTGRQQTIHSVASHITSEDIPEPWMRASIAHIAPIANEVDPEVIHLFSNSIVGLAPQGWMRRWDNQGHIFQEDWPAAENYLGKAAVTFVSIEDLPERSTLDCYIKWSQLLVLTLGPEGCVTFYRGKEERFPGELVNEVNLTGAGDVFAASFLIRFFQTAGNYREAARFANKVAGISIGYSGLDAKISAIRQFFIQ